MDTSRRSFLKCAGAAAAVGCALPVANAVSATLKTDPKALKGKHWAMVVDTAKFTAPDHFKKVIAACHDYHNVPTLPEDKKKIEIKWIWTDGFANVFAGQENHYQSDTIKNRPFLALCNHCENPPCVRVCPTKATFKNMATGIVMMDMHRCIGCRYCMAGCPYGARSFNFADPRKYLKTINPIFPTRTKGVVEKCTFCYERLAEGKMPSCVEASEGRLIFGDLADEKSNVRKVLKERFSIRRKPDLGTEPSVYYLI
jgi:Fe-S-cluster-containing dehydrogenase component